MSMLPYFSYNPFETYEEEVPVAGDWGGTEKVTRMRPSQAMKESDPWRYENWSGQSNVMVEDVADDGSYIVRVKTGNKEGTRYKLTPDGKGGYVSSEIDRFEWDTNPGKMNKTALIAFGGLLGAGALTNYLTAGSVFGSGAAAGETLAGSAATEAIGGSAAGGLAEPALALNPLAGGFAEPTLSLTIPGVPDAALATMNPGAWMTSAPLADTFAPSASIFDKVLKVGKTVVDALGVPGTATLIAGAAKIGAALYTDKEQREMYERYMQKEEQLLREKWQIDKETREDEQAWRTSEREASQDFQKKLIEEQRAYEEQKKQEELERKNRNWNVSNITFPKPWKMKDRGLVGSSLAIGG